MKPFRKLGAAVLLLFCDALVLQAQIDPEERHLLQIGYNQPLQGRGPIGGYAFYYLNKPNYFHTNQTLRLAIAPIYLDTEYGFRGAIGPDTDVGVGLAGGGFADSYSEVRLGKLLSDESFTGHGGEVSGSIYNLFNPGDRIPVNGVLRGTLHYSSYTRNGSTAGGFSLPRDRAAFHLRSGVRWGGREPLMFPAMAMEVSAWYEGQFRGTPGVYGFAADREIKPLSHLAWSRALIAYTLPESKHYFSFTATGGMSVDPDRLSAYRLGGALPLVGEFPLSIPGYYFQELTASRFLLFNGLYSIPIGRSDHWDLMASGATGLIDYLPGVEQPGDWHSGVGGAVAFHPGSGAWQVVAGYGYGIDAIRGNHRGAHTIGLLVQYDFDRGGSLFRNGLSPLKWRGFDRLLGR